ncbi:MAG: hypothetical protein FJ242_04760 [Nitrospira sp.]|nr:hypothetical protein [Nitrospira sp.]
MDIETLTLQIKRNCNISDAKYWGTYSICGLLLRLRELCRIEKGIKPWEKTSKQEVAEWISERENLWQELEDKGFIDIAVDRNTYDPFEVYKINNVLEKEGLIYGAGYGAHMKPSFFLADLISKKTVDSYAIYIAGTEHVRDLSAYPAMLQDGVIFARVDTTKLLLWEKFDELKLRGAKGFLTFAFSRYGITPEDEPSEDIDRELSLIASSETETFIHHELGEVFEGEKFGGEWKSLLMNLSYSKGELFARGIKDLLSDTSEKGMIHYIIENQKEGSLGFYIVFLGGYRRLLFPEMLEASKRFMDERDWGLIEDARKTGYTKAEAYAEKLISLYRTDKNWFSKYVETEILSRLS